jgi:hypothetical protein
MKTANSAQAQRARNMRMKTGTFLPFLLQTLKKSGHLTLHDGQVIKIIRWWQLAGSFT